MKKPFRLVAILALIASPLLIAFLNLGGNFAAAQQKAARDVCARHCNLSPISEVT